MKDLVHSYDKKNETNVSTCQTTQQQKEPESDISKNTVPLYWRPFFEVNGKKRTADLRMCGC